VLVAASDRLVANRLKGHFVCGLCFHCRSHGASRVSVAASAARAFLAPIVDRLGGERAGQVRTFASRRITCWNPRAYRYRAARDEHAEAPLLGPARIACRVPRSARRGCESELPRGDAPRSIEQTARSAPFIPRPASTRKPIVSAALFAIRIVVSRPSSITSRDATPGRDFVAEERRAARSRVRRPA